MEQIYWQIITSQKYDFAVLLDKEYAYRLVSFRVPKEKIAQMNRLAEERLEELGFKWHEPYSFYDNSALVEQIYMGNNGKWLAISQNDISDLVNRQRAKMIKYDSHNIDTAREFHALIAIFEMWINYSDLLIE